MGGSALQQPMGSNPEWGPIFCKVLITAQGISELTSLRGSTLVPEQLNKKEVIKACKLIDDNNLVLCSATVSVASAGICHRNIVNSIT